MYLYVLKKKNNFKVGITVDFKARYITLKKSWANFLEGSFAIKCNNKTFIRWLESSIKMDFNEFRDTTIKQKDGWTEFFTNEGFDAIYNHINIIAISRKDVTLIEKLPKIPVFDEKKSKAIMGRARILSIAEIKRVYDTISKQKHSLRNRCMFDLSLVYGLRSSQIVSLHLKDLIVDDKLVDSFKTRYRSKHRTIVLSNETVRKHLEEYLEIRKGENPELRFIKSQMGKFNAGTLGEVMRVIYDKTGIKDASSNSGWVTWNHNKEKFGANYEQKGLV